MGGGETTPPKAVAEEYDGFAYALLLWPGALLVVVVVRVPVRVVVRVSLWMTVAEGA